MKLALGALLIALVACDGGGKKPVTLVDGSVDSAPATCNPLTQTGCAAGEKCANRTLQGPPNEINEIACVPDGTVGQDMPCTEGAPGATGYSNCAKGFECVSSVCKQICDPQGGTPKCDGQHACSRYDGLFESGDMTVAGVCDPKCDPLTQALLVGTNTAACGSQNPATPNAACYTFDRIDFTCAGIPMPARGLTDRMKAYGPASGGAYVNGCAAGYVPFFFEQTGSTTIVCSGLCAPAKTDNTPANMGNARGDVTVPAKLHTSAAPVAGDGVCAVGKKGSEANENCHYLWWYNFDDNDMLIPSPYNDTLGVCFGFTHYNFDHDMNQGTPNVGFPACQQLPPKGGTPDPIYKTADQWPCIPSTEALPFAKGKVKVNPIAKDFRVGSRTGEGLRHLVRER